MDLSPLYAVDRRDGRGRPAFDPAMMLALSLYALFAEARGVSTRLQGAVEVETRRRWLRAAWTRPLWHAIA